MLMYFEYKWVENGNKLDNDIDIRVSLDVNIFANISFYFLVT